MTESQSNDVILARLEDFRAEVKGDLEEIKTQVKITNGRVTALEMWRHGLVVLADSRAWFKPAFVAFISGGALAVIAAAATAYFAHL